MRAHSFLIHLMLICCAYGSGFNLFSPPISSPLPYGFARPPPIFLQPVPPPPLPILPQPIFLQPAPPVFQSFPPLSPTPGFPLLPFPLPAPPGPPPSVVVSPKTAAILSIASLLNSLITRKFFRYPTIRRVPVLVPVPVAQSFADDFTSIPILKKYRQISSVLPPTLSYHNEFDEHDERWKPKAIPLNKYTTINEDHSMSQLALEDDDDDNKIPIDFPK